MSDTYNRDYQSFIDGAKRIATNRVFTSPLTTYAYGIDASCYSYTPRVAIFAHNETEVAELIKLANLYNTPITFRAAGSSLSADFFEGHMEWGGIHVGDVHRHLSNTVLLDEPADGFCSLQCSGNHYLVSVFVKHFFTGCGHAAPG